MAQKVGTERIKREDGWLYYIGKDGYVWASGAKHSKFKGKKRKIGSEKISKEKGFMYFLGSDGFVYKTRMKNA